MLDIGCGWGSLTRAIADRHPRARITGNEIFPESEPPRLAEIAHAAEKLFEFRSLVNDRADYARTCAEWLRRLRVRRAEAEQIAGAAVTEAYERYLEASIRQFEFTGCSSRIGNEPIGHPQF
ncbi:hypothetical protein NRB20_56420 [Nocardia sp. RB20]|uniref:Methyltransferase n=1 Tax=Nocardia macrotermitis TaxID=2585198 RepID=A0A7K0DCB1_9NOCA|nr:hypothetical protein [Nocardia macrotermitis]